MGLKRKAPWEGVFLEGRPFKEPHAGRKASYSARALHTAERKVLRLQETLRKGEERARRKEKNIHLLEETNCQRFFPGLSWLFV